MGEKTQRSLRGEKKKGFLPSFKRETVTVLDQEEGRINFSTTGAEKGGKGVGPVLRLG